MTLLRTESNGDRVYGNFDPLLVHQSDAPDQFWEPGLFGVKFVLDGDPLIAGTHDHSVRKASVGGLDTQALVTLRQHHHRTANIIYPPYWQRGQSSSSPMDKSELRALAIADKIYALSGKDDDIALLRVCFSAVESAFEKSELEVVNALLGVLDISKVPVIATLGIARATGRAKKWLPLWASYVAKLKDHLIAQGEVVSQSMRGLINKDDQFTFVTRRVVL